MGGPFGLQWRVPKEPPGPVSGCAQGGFESGSDGFILPLSHMDANDTSAWGRLSVHRELGGMLSHSAGGRHRRQPNGVGGRDISLYNNNNNRTQGEQTNKANTMYKLGEK